MWTYHPARGEQASQIRYGGAVVLENANMFTYEEGIAIVEALNRRTRDE